MCKITQIIINNIKYNDVLADLLAPNPTIKAYPEQIILKTIMIIALTSGLPLEYIIQLKWKAILTINSKSQAQINETINITRYYKFPINNKLHLQLSEFYNYLNQPSLDSKIVDGHTKAKDLDSLLLPLYISMGLWDIKELSKDEIATYKNKQLTQILFGRRVFEVCAYTNTSSKFLKVFFKIKTNKELFNFLGYKSRSEINYNLSNISLIEGVNDKHLHGPAPSFMDDNKHFHIQIDNTNKYYPFQHFQVFYDFLNQVYLYKIPLITQGMVVLLLISLTNGIRLSSLLKLKWVDIINLNQKDSLLLFKKKIVFKNKELIINEDIMKKIGFYFENLMQFYGETGISYEGKERVSFINQPDIDSSIFVSNKGNTLTQNSLHRELHNALKLLGFQHWNKFTTKSTLIMYGRRIIELKGQHKPTIKLLKEHYNFRIIQKLFEFLYIDEYKGNVGKQIKGFNSISEHILYNV